MGYIPGYIPQTEIIVSGHFDSIDRLLSSCAPGADDDASGTAAAIEVARIFSQQSFPVTITIAAWAAEEANLKGSIHYANWADSNNIDIRAIMNMDMIGYMNDSICDCIAMGTSWLTNIFMQSGQNYSPMMAIYQDLGGAPWDAAPFYVLGYPAFTCSENPEADNPYQHTTEDLLDKLSPNLIAEVTKTVVATIAILELYPSKVNNIEVDQTSDDTTLQLIWSANQETDVVGYWIWWGNQSGSYSDSVYVPGRLTVCDTISGLEPNEIAYFIIRAVNGSNQQSYLADEVFGMPVIFSLDQGILVVDETNNWTTGSFPRDAQQDSFYNYIFSDYKYELYEYGLTSQKPTLADFGPYSTVAWLADDYAGMLASGAVSDMKSYLDNGGKMWFAGWKPSSDIGSDSYDQFKISPAGLSGITDSFKTAIGLKGYPDIAVDTLKYPATIWGKTFRYIEAFTPLAEADTIYVMDMKNNGSSYEGRACAVRDSGKTVFFGFPLYFMDKDQARLAAQQVMLEFGEPYVGVEGKPGNRGQGTAFRLEQNAPNPFRQTTVISYRLPKAGMVSLKIYNIAGQTVKTLVNTGQTAGRFTVIWDGCDDHGINISNGVYIYRLQAGETSQTRKMIVLK
ncbi:MAG: M20/M25/M40 family metallo-hydrolase [bacterium]|nr:M20/M25/M40 family metallo-hydrolase [bacterium]